jgi:hypothetical protein
MKGEKITTKKIFEVEVFFSSQNTDFPLFEETLGAFLFLFFLFLFSILFLYFFLCSVSWGHGGCDDI